MQRNMQDQSTSDASEGILFPQPSEVSLEPLEDSRYSLSDKGPRSRVVEAILLLLYAKPMKSSEIASILGKKTKLISSYLSYWKSRGYVVLRTGYWFLTKKGEEHVKALLSSLDTPVLSPYDVVRLAQKLISEPVLETMNSWRRQDGKPKETVIQQFTASKTGSLVGKQGTKNENTVEKTLKCLEKIISSKDLLEDETNILRHMVKHYAEWGSTYLYLDQISEELHYPSNELMLILRKLQTKKLIYMYTDKRFGIRVGLGKSLKQLIDACLAR
ncbi:MAG: replication initiator protein WhiP [Ignisphaera sp.]